MGKGSRAIASSVDADGNVGDGEVILIFVLTVDVDNLRDDSACGTDVVGRFLLALHGDTDDIVSAHLTGNVGREIVAEATVDEHHVAHPDRRECSRDGHTGTHSYAEHTAMEVVLGVVNDIGSHTGKRDGKGVEVDGVIIRCRERIEERIDILTDDKASTIGSLLSQIQTRGNNIGVLPLALLQALVAEVVLIGEHICPVLYPDHGIEFGSAIATSIEAADDTAHAGTGDDVDGNASTLDNFQRTYVGHAFGTATAEHDGHSFTLRRLLGKSDLC